MIGVFGGTFDPPHVGHLILAVEARFQLGLRRVLWALTADPPHKPESPHTSAALRLQLLEAAISGQPAFELSRVDVDRPGPHYALDTMRLLQEQIPGERWAYLMGGDSLRDLPGWHRPAEFVERCDLVGVMSRPEALPELEALDEQLPSLRARLRFLEAPYVDLSASDIRDRVRRGQPFEHLLPAGVARLIQESGLYR